MSENESKWASTGFHHRRYEPTHEVSFWKSESASVVETADLAVVELLFGCNKVEFKFSWPAQKDDMLRLERALEIAFLKGRADKADEVRKVLGAASS